MESKPLPPKSEASKLSPLKSPKTNNKESPRASRSDDVSVERKSSGSSSASVTRSAYAKKTSTKVTESTSEAAKEQSNLKKPSMDTSLEEAKRNAAAALSRPARLGNTNKLVDLNNYVAPKATPAKDKSKKGDKKMSVDPPRKSLLPPWGRKHVPQSSRSPSNDTPGINNKNQQAPPVASIHHEEKMQQHQQQNIFGFRISEGFCASRFRERERFVPTVASCHIRISHSAAAADQQQQQQQQKQQQQQQQQQSISPTPLLTPAHLSMATQENRPAFDLWGGLGFGASIFADRPDTTGLNRDQQLERTQSEGVKDEDEGLNFHLPDMDFDELE